ncbi:MAG: ABC transporter permease [Deltaproteobacteria bacterium]|nr:MAG: ABC transporter permease [Deltaproteobacteria bacterium]
MMLLLKLAARNLLRNKRRTAITMAGISLGLALMVFSNNIAYGSHNDMLRTAISMMAGHVVVQGEGYQADPDSERKVLHSGELQAAIQQALPDAHVLRRVYLDGLLVSPVASTAVAIKAVEPSREAAVSKLDDKLTGGEWLADDDDRGAVLGVNLAESLDVGLGDKIVFMGQPDGDEVESRLFRVRGIFATGSPEIDGFTAVVHLAAAQELLQGEDPSTQIAVNLADDDATEDALAVVEQVVAGFPQAGPLEVLPWRQAIPDIVEFVELDSAYGDGIWLVLGIIVSMGVINTVLMSVLERVREFGVMMAVGMRPRRLAVMVLAEGFIMGAVSAAIGIVIGLLVTWPFMATGLDLSGQYGDAMEAGGVPVSMILYPEIDRARLAIYPFIGVFFAVLASLYPAFKVTRLSPVQAIRHQ